MGEGFLVRKCNVVSKYIYEGIDFCGLMREFFYVRCIENWFLKSQGIFKWQPWSQLSAIAGDGLASHADVLSGSSRVGQERVTNH